MDNSLNRMKSPDPLNPDGKAHSGLLQATWKVPSGWRIVRLDWASMPEARLPCCQNFLATSAGHFTQATGHDRARPNGAEEFIFAWLLAGCGWCDMLGKRHIIQPGDLMVLHPRTPHAYGFATEADFTLRWFHCLGPAAAQMSAALSGGKPVVHVGADAAQIALHEEALCALEQVDSPGQLSLGSQLLAGLVAQWTWRQPAPTIDRLGSMSDRLEQLMRYLHSHLAEPLKPGAIAARMQLSASHLRAVFQQHTGQPLSRWLLETRMDRARALLTTTKLSVKEVAVAVGFSDPLYFSRVFTRHFRTPPSLVRRLTP